MTGSSTREPLIHLVPMSLSNLPKALWISWESFKGEWYIVWLTYVWHLARVHRLPSVIPMVRRRCLRLDSKGRFVGTIDILSTPVHESDTRWVVLDLQHPVEGAAVAEFLMQLMPRCRLAVLQVTGHVRCLDEADCVEYVGSLPGSDRGELPIYSVRRERVPGTGFNGFSTVSRACSQPAVDAEFHLIQRGPRTVGITGLYVTDPWPHIGWGGWGTIRRRFAQRHTVLDSLSATENLARRRGREWFCIMTSSSPQYRSACRMYEYYGLTRLLCVEDFFRSVGKKGPRDGYLVYGKRT